MDVSALPPSVMLFVIDSLISPCQLKSGFCAAFLSQICFHIEEETNWAHPTSYHTEYFTLGSVFRPYDKNGPSWEQEKKKLKWPCRIVWFSGYFFL